MGKMHINKELSRIRILATALLPLVRFGLGRAVSIQEAIEALKLAFIEAAAREFEGNGEKINVSRLSAATGLRRREVKRLFFDERPKENQAGTITKIVGLWAAARQFTTETGRPRTLDIEREFPRLVRQVSSDLNPGTVLFELERLGLVARTQFGLKLKKPGIIRTSEELMTYELIADDLSDLFGAISGNIGADKEDKPNPHAKTFFDNIEEQSVPKIKAWLRKENKRIHKRLRDFLSQFDLDVSGKSGRGGCRVVFGTFGKVDNREEG